VTQPRFRLIPGARLTATTGREGVGWRLLGSNNRELGRSATSFADAESALVAIGRARQLASEGEAHIVHDPRTGLWSWHLDGDSATAATSGRGFRYERECRYNLEQFREAAPTAPSSDHDSPTEFPWQRTTSISLHTEATS